jgi:hypothetical protein
VINFLLTLLASFVLLTSISVGSGLGALVSQHPSKVVCKSGTSVKIECRCMDLQAPTIFWYRQFPQQSFTLMATSNVGSGVTYEKGFNQTKFPISHPNLTFSSLTVMNTHPEDNSFYLCGPSDTVLGGNQGSQQEHLNPPALPTPHTQGALNKKMWRIKRYSFSG